MEARLTHFFGASSGHCPEGREEGREEGQGVLEDRGGLEGRRSRAFQDGGSRLRHITVRHVLLFGRLSSLTRLCFLLANLELCVEQFLRL